MKKLQLISMFFGVLFFTTLKMNCLLAQDITVPDYSYGAIQSQYGTVTSYGVTNPGPYGGYSYGEDQRASGIFFANGYRWWGYPSYPLMICGKLPDFNFPGNHGVTDMSGLGCANPPIGFKGSWGGVIAEPASRTIWSITGARNNDGPTEKYCIEVPWLPSGQICYAYPSTWGYGSSYGYLRKAFIVQSTGALQTGDPVEISASLTAGITREGDGTATGMGVLFVHRISETPWYQTGFSREYLTWSTIEDFFGAPDALAKVVISENGTENYTGTTKIGDIIIVEVGFNNTITLPNLGSSGGDAEGWSGKRPNKIFTNILNTRTDSIKNIIKQYGNRLTYDLVCLTQGALLSPLTPGGPNTDEDKDGISDAREKGPDGNDSNFDGNSDGIPDYKQVNVASFHTYDGANYTTLVVPSGTELSQMKVTDNPSPSDTPADAEFPWGFFDFSIDGIDPGDAVTVTLILHEATSVSKYYKYGVTPDNPEPHWYDFTYDGQTGAEINGNTITLHFIDGQRGDEDITANGSIKEPGGPAIAGTTGIPELADNPGLVVYPNPAVNNITLRLNNILPGNNYLITIFSNTGGIVSQKVIDVCDSNEEFNISTANLSSGLYLITLSGSNFNFKTKFIKLK
ncbi:MAG TPA: hypothetical protein DDW27_15025 [Bacteroidales bacterium]|nr:hypothetical protein [Bacteroidales bacterium]